MKCIEALESKRKKLGGPSGHDLVGDLERWCLCQPEVDGVSTCLHRVEAVLKCLRWAPNEVGDFLRESQDADHGLGLKADEGLILSVKWPLQAAKIKVDAHSRSLPEEALFSASLPRGAAFTESGLTFLACAPLKSRDRPVAFQESCAGRACVPIGGRQRRDGRWRRSGARGDRFAVR